MVNQRKSVEHLFEQALALKASERGAFLDEACSGSPALREMVERLLEEDARAGSFLNSPLFGRPKIAGPRDEVAAEDWSPIRGGSRAGDTVSDGSFSENEVLAGRFRIVRFIAAGGMGEVYEVEDRQLQGVRLALKTILPHIAANPHMQERFEREVLLARRVVHPNLCPIYDIFHCRHQDTDLMFLTMKLLPGETLSSRIKREGAISLDEARRIVSQVGTALAAAHDAGILHRDIKTANIMLAGSGEQVHAWVTDFGLARAYQGDTTVLTVDGVAGTPGYVAPELFHGVPPSKASDVYAFGVVVYKMVTGFSPPVRLDPNAKVTRDPFIEQLPAEWKRLLEYCLEPSVAKRCQSFPEVLDLLCEGDRRKMPPRGVAVKLSRRRLLAMGAGAAGAVVGGVWLDWPQIDFAMHPLPAKRFVALLDWPTASDARIAPMIAAAVDAIGSELARAEAFDQNLFIIPHHVGKDVGSLAQLNDVRESLGANLVLAVSGMPGAGKVRFLLRVLDPMASRTLRQKEIIVAMDNQLSLPEKAVRVAAELLNITHYEPDDKRIRVETSNPEAYTAFQVAEAALKKDNDAGLDAAIDKYREAIEIDPRYALATARLAWAYCRFYAIHKDPAALSIAESNSASALTLNPNLVEGHLAMASVFGDRGDHQKSFSETAKALAIDPSNPRTLVFLAELYSDANRWVDAEATFTRVLQLRPNYWWAHHELGVLYNCEGKYPQALSEFRAVTLEVPTRAIGFSNVGAVYLQQGKISEAIANLTRSNELEPMPSTANSMALALRATGKTLEALEFAKKSVALGPEDSYNWMVLGDCYSYLPGHQNDAKNAYAKSASFAEQELQTNPENGPGWMILALVRIKAGVPVTSEELIEKAQKLSADDVDSQLFRARILELLGKREESLAVVSRCLDRGATLFQFQTMPDMGSLLKDVRFASIARSHLSLT